ncbi:MAG: glycoside hydrolase family 127 protein, partial [Candidatus Hydrogenedentes bacterium]|nr:glycoside hydrolase family 127 protein [Candidatus Hydrogenedentota bacterium]
MKVLFSVFAGFAALFLATFSQADVLESIDTSRVNVGGEIGHRIDVTIDNNLLALDADGDFLKPFQEKKAQGGYIGLGKLIDALVRSAAYSKDPRVLERKRHVVREILATQDADGYIGQFVPDKRMWALWDIHEMAYLIYGLTMDYQFFEEKPSLEAARKAADYLITHWKAEPTPNPGGGSITVYMAVTGLEPALLALYESTGDQKYVDFCVVERNLAAWNGPIVLGRWGPIQGHAYAYMTRCLAQTRLYRIQPDPKLLKTTHKMIDFLLEHDGLVITGTCGQHECWHDTQEGAATLGETCATAYLIRLLDSMLRLEGDTKYGDMIERAVYNALFAAQSPDGRRIRYYAPFEGPRVYFDGDTWCCPSNYRRIIAELPRMIYYRQNGGITVLLYTESEAQIDLEDDLSVTVKQETEYPSGGKVVLSIEPSRDAAFDLRFRVPGWCDSARVSVNGEAVDTPLVAGSFGKIRRIWKKGDRVELDLPMTLRLIKGTQSQAGRVAIMYGPRVFTLNPERNPELGDTNPRILTIDPATLQGP